MQPSTNQSDLANHVQALLFAEGGTLSLKRLSQLTDVTDLVALEAAIAELAKKLDRTGLSIIKTETEVTLAVAAKESELLRANYEKELGREVGEAGLEVLAIILYRGPSTRAQIDYIRGVNTSSTIRTLLARGLLERAGNPSDNREYIYRPTVELLAHIGAQKVQDLPEYGTISSELRVFEENQEHSQEPFNKKYDRDNIESEGGSIAGG